jgi:hypothetical protein
MLLSPATNTGGQRFLRGVLLLVACGLCGTFDILNNNFARWAARVNSLPEEEEFHSKDRSALIAAAQPSRRGGLRPRSTEPATFTVSHRNCHGCEPAASRASTASQFLTGAGIFQHC